MNWDAIDEFLLEHETAFVIGAVLLVVIILAVERWLRRSPLSRLKDWEPPPERTQQPLEGWPWR